MNQTISTYSLQQVLTYPFKDKDWKAKILIGLCFSIGGIIVPILPTLFMMGYASQIIRHMIIEKGDPYLPEWNDLGKYLGDGWRLFSVSFVYNLPAILISVLGWVAYIIGFIGMATAGESYPDSFLSILFFFMMGIFIVSITLTILLMIAVSMILPAVIGHTVAQGTFNSGFDFTGWWKILRANMGGFFLSLIIIYGLLAFLYLISQIFYTTIILICLAFVVMLAGGFYLMLVGAALIGLAYREGVEKIKNTEAPV